MVVNLAIEKTNFSLIPKDKIKDVLKSFGLIVEQDKETEDWKIFLSENDRINDVSAKCSGCGNEITIESFGHFAKGSKLLYCKNPLCFNHYLALKKIKVV